MRLFDWHTLITHELKVDVDLVSFVLLLSRKTFLCFLTNTNGEFTCSVSRDDGDEDIFMDMDVFELSLCQSQNNFTQTCELLEAEYAPEINSKEHTGLFSRENVQLEGTLQICGCMSVFNVIS